MPEFRLPLSGDVTQTINPWTWAFRAVGVQVEQMNVYMGDSSNPRLEDDILKTVGTYGRQIGQIGDALRVIISRVNLGKLNATEHDAIKALEAQLDTVDRLKRQHGVSPLLSSSGLATDIGPSGSSGTASTKTSRIS
jgi:hypothetical protein